MTRLVAHLSQSLSEKATDQERYMGRVTIEKNPKPKVALVDRIKTNYTPAFLFTGDGALHLNGYVPKETIIDTGAAKVMIG